MRTLVVNLNLAYVFETLRSYLNIYFGDFSWNIDVEFDDTVTWNCYSVGVNRRVLLGFPKSVVIKYKWYWFQW